jgi:YHS domain-containing protein
MIRFLGLLLAFIFIVPLIRMVVGAAGRLFSSFAMGKSGAGPGAGTRVPKAAAGGTLHKDPVCGTYVSEAVALTHASRGQTHYFCGEECRAKYLRQAS